MPRRNRPYLNDSSAEPEVRVRDNATSPAVPPIPSGTAPADTASHGPSAFPPPAVSESQDLPRKSAEADKYPPEDSSAENLPPADFQLRRRKTTFLSDNPSDSDAFDPQKALNRRRQQEASSSPNSVRDGWLRSSQNVGYIPPDSGSGHAHRQRPSELPSKLTRGARTLQHDLGERLDRGKKSETEATSRRSPGTRAGTGSLSGNPPRQNGSAGNRTGNGSPAGSGFSLFGRSISSDTIRLILMGIFGAIALFSLVMIARIVWRSIRTSQLNDELSQKHSQFAEADTTSEPIIYQAELDSEGTVPDETVATDETPPAELDDSVLSTELVAVETEESASGEPSEPVATSTPPPAVLSTKFHQIGGEALPEMAALYKDNHDLVGWLNIPEVLDLPVVYKDNVYYLTHDFHKQKNTSGTLFLDVNHPYKEKSQNLLFHGHNMRDGSMFGRLTQYKSNLTFLKNNCFINYSSLWEKDRYVIFAVLQVSLNPRDSSFFNYFTHMTFQSDLEFVSYISDLMDHSMYAIPVDVKPSDALITLSTCLDDDRLVIVARKCRQGESTHRLKELVSSASRQ
ncbi:MAG: sortase [Clostridia bacterium]|nr:sortase [Clostridia bacterium]